LLFLFIFQNAVFSLEVLIIGDAPIEAVEQHVNRDEIELVRVVVPTSDIARSLRKVYGANGKLKIYRVPLFTHSKRFVFYTDGERISPVFEEGLIECGIKRCLSLDDFCKKIGIKDDTELYVEWGNAGYYLVRYANVRRFTKVVVTGLSPEYQTRWNWYRKKGLL